MENVEKINISIYLFGSFVYNMEANDIDILVTYDAKNIHGNYQLLRTLKYNVSNSILSNFNLPVHFTTLSLKEVNEFLGKDRTYYIPLL